MNRTKIFGWVVIVVLVVMGYVQVFVPTNGPAKAAPLIYLLDESTRPTVTPTPRPTPVSATHVVRPGETLTSIARQYGTTVDNLVGLNPRLAENPNLIFAGQEIRIR